MPARSPVAFGKNALMSIRRAVHLTDCQEELSRSGEKRVRREVKQIESAEAVMGSDATLIGSGGKVLRSGVKPVGSQNIVVENEVIQAGNRWESR